MLYLFVLQYSPELFRCSEASPGVQVSEECNLHTAKPIHTQAQAYEGNVFIMQHIISRNIGCNVLPHHIKMKSLPVCEGNKDSKLLSTFEFVVVITETNLYNDQ
jgi:hypothetical protein